MADQDARAEAERRWPRYPWSVEFSSAKDRQNAFIQGAEWERARLLAEIRAGIEALHSSYYSGVEHDQYEYSKRDALAVLDRVAGNETTEAGL